MNEWLVSWLMGEGLCKCDGVKMDGWEYEMSV